MSRILDAIAEQQTQLDFAVLNDLTVFDPDQPPTPVTRLRTEDILEPRAHQLDPTASARLRHSGRGLDRNQLRALTQANADRMSRYAVGMPAQ